MSAIYNFSNADEILNDNAIRGDIESMVGADFDALRFLYAATLKALAKAKTDNGETWKGKRPREKSQFINSVLTLLKSLAVSKTYEGGSAEVGVTPSTYRSYCQTVMLSLKYDVSLEVVRQHSNTKRFTEAQNLIAKNGHKYKDKDDPDNRDLQWLNALNEAQSKVDDQQDEANNQRQKSIALARQDADLRELPPFDHDNDDVMAQKIEESLIYYFIDKDLLFHYPSLKHRPLIKAVDAAIKKAVRKNQQVKEKVAAAV